MVLWELLLGLTGQGIGRSEIKKYLQDSDSLYLTVSRFIPRKNQNYMILLNKEKETLLIPLYGRAKESKKKAPILYDKKALEIVEKIDYDFKSLKIPGKTNTMMCLRAKLIDNFVIDHLEHRNKSIVLHLGCGLDSRYDRIRSSKVLWHDIDFGEVIEIRKNFYSASENYQMIPSSVTASEWIENIPAGGEDYLVIAEGLFMYLKEDEIKTLLDSLKKSIGSYTLIFDAFSKYTAGKLKNHPSIKSTGATIYWGIDNPKELTRWNSGYRYIKEIVFTSNEEINKMNFLTKLIYKIADIFPVARNAHRIFTYRID